jgi:glycosyltransferase involved in cell wall biosynthesis
MLREVKLDATRTHFMGKLPRAQYIKVLQVSAAHVYLTYPFVLSWSLLEAMACGANIVASDTAPVREVIRDGVDGRLCSFFDPGALSRMMFELATSSATPGPSASALNDSKLGLVVAAAESYRALLAGRATTRQSGLEPIRWRPPVSQASRRFSS